MTLRSRRDRVDWFSEDMDRKVSFIINLLLEQDPFLLGYLWFFLRFSKYIFRPRGDGAIYVAFKKVYPIRAVYVTNLLRDLSSFAINFDRKRNRFHARFILPFIYRALLTDTAYEIFPILIREKISVFRGILTAIIDLYGRIKIGKKPALVFRIPEKSLESIVLERVRIDRVSIRNHGARTYRYLVVRDERKIERVLKLIKPVNPERILEIALYRKAISEEEAIRIKRSIENRFVQYVFRERRHSDPEPSRLEKAYILGFATGDIAVKPSGRKIVAELTTTHPEAILLFHRMFDKYGRVSHVARIYRKTDQSFIYLRAYLSKDSWSFLMNKGKIDYIKRETRDLEKFKHFLAGLFDAEGTIIITKSGIGRVQLATRITLGRIDILRYIHKKLGRIGIKTHIYRDKKSNCYKLTATSREAIKLLKFIPMKHTEKIRKARIAFKHHGEKWSRDIEEELKRYRELISRQKEELKTLIEKGETT